MIKKLLSLESRMWIVNFLNVLATGLALNAILISRNPQGISIFSWMIFLFVQLTFAQFGYRTKSKALFICMSVCALISTTIIAVVIYLR